MMNKHFILKVILFSGAAAIAVLVYSLFIVSNKTHTPDAKTVKAEKGVYDQTCYTSIQKDTLISLFKTAYGNALEIKEKDDDIALIYTASDQSAPEFYNGNEALLKFDSDDFGFEIEETKTGLDIKFKQEANAVNVPNDILIKLMSKYKLKQTTISK